MNPIKPNFKSEIFPILVIFSVIISAFFFYTKMPEQVPVHWNYAGEIDRYGSKIEACLLFPAIISILYLLFLFLPILDPKKERYDQFKRVYHIIKNVTILFLGIMFFITSLNAIGYNIPVNIWVPTFVGLLFIILGNYLSKIKSNWFVGIRTPWTLSSEEVWNKTHRLASKLFVLAGIIMILINLLPTKFIIPVFLINIFGTIITIIVYSYIIYRKEIIKQTKS